MRYAGSAWPEWGQIQRASSKTDPDHVPFYIMGRMVIDWSESYPFLYIRPTSDIDALYRIPLAWTKPDMTRLRRNGSGSHPAFLFRAGGSSTDPNRIRFSTSFLFRYRCVMPDPFGLNEARSDPPMVKQIDWDHIQHLKLFRAGWPSTDPNRIRFKCIASDTDALTRIRLAWTMSDPTHLRLNRSGRHSGISIPGRMVIDRSESDPFLQCIWPASDIYALSRIRLAWKKLDPIASGDR